MHELSLAENVLQIIEDAAHAQGFSRVRTVVLEIGCLAAVEPQAMAFCFDAVTRGSCAEGAVLEIVDVPGAGWCVACAASVPITDMLATCPHCGGYRVNPTAGTGMRVKELEVE